MPTVSVVIPTRNRAQLLKAALESALGQTWGDLESIASVAAQAWCGGDMSGAWRVLNSYIASQPDEIRREAIREIRKLKVYLMLRHALTRAFNWLPGWEFLEQFRGRHVFNGSRQHFQNMQECGRVAPELIERIAAQS